MASPQSRARAVDEIGAKGDVDLSTLLQWARKAPAGVDESGLDVGLADAFGRLRAKDAIPFLIHNLGMQREIFYRANIWMKTPKVVEDNLPAVAALIQIGPEASRAVAMKFETLRHEDRLAAIFVISRVQGVAESRDFLNSVIGGANMEKLWAERGLAGIDEGEPSQ